MTVIVVSVGTDHHRFDRLTGWLTQWWNRNPEVQLVVQHGTSRPVAGARNSELMPHPELMQWFRAADAVVLQGGPGGVMDARANGIQPIVVPRDPAWDEHVDGHQLDFATHLAQRGLAHVVTDEMTLAEALDATVTGDRDWRIDPTTEVPAGVRAINDLLAVPPVQVRGGRWRRVRAVWGRRG